MEEKAVEVVVEDEFASEEMEFVEHLWNKTPLGNEHRSTTAKAEKAFPAKAERRLKQSKTVQTALHNKRQALLATELANEAVANLRDLMRPGNPGQVRLGAVKLTLALAGHSGEESERSHKKLEDLTAAELAEMIGQLDGALSARADAARPVAQGKSALRAVIDGEAPSAASDSDGEDTSSST